MPDQTVPTPRPPSQLAPSGRRALAATVLTTAAHVPPVCASQLVDALDAASWAVLGTAGLTPLEARDLLAALWIHEPAD
jgi:hypothetical protein